VLTGSNYRTGLSKDLRKMQSVRRSSRLMPTTRHRAIGYRQQVLPFIPSPMARITNVALRMVAWMRISKAG